jgi:L-lactate utilization protein LutC
MSDFAEPMTDDVALIPSDSFAIAQDVPAVGPSDPQTKADEAAENKEAAPYWHPAWEVVEEKLRQLLEEYDGNNIMQYKDLPAQEFQVKVLAQAVVRAEITKLMEDVRHAVQSVESRKQRSNTAE